MAWSAPRLRLQAGLLVHLAVAEDALCRYHLVLDLINTAERARLGPTFSEYFGEWGGGWGGGGPEVPKSELRFVLAAREAG